MFKKSMLAVCLCGLTWAGTAQAGFFNNNLELQFLNSLLSSVQVPAGSSGTVVNVPTNIPNIGDITVTLNDTSADVYVPDNLLGLGLKITDLTVPVDPVINAGSDGGIVTYGPNYVQIDELPSDTTTTVTVSTVPEPGALNLVALGLTILGMTTYMRRRARA